VSLPKGSKPGRVLELASVVLAFGYLFLFLFHALQRVAYPFELEWMEGGALEHLQRVLRGEPLYATPSIEFVPFPYPPFYYYLAAALSPLTGAGFFTLRLISLVSSLATSALIFRWVQRDTQRTVLAAASAATFLATWHASGLYFDVARLDALFCALLLLWLYGLRFHRTERGLVFSGVVAFLAVMTKQTGAVVVAPVALWCVFCDWRASGRSFARFREWSLTRFHVLPITVLGALGTLLLDGILDENFLRHVVGAQQQHGILPWKVGLFFGGDLLSTLPVACLVVLGWLALRLGRAGTQGVRPDERAASAGFHAVVLAGILLACLIPRIKVSGAANSLIPAYAWLAVSFGVGLGRLRAFAVARRPGLAAARLDAVVAFCCVVQLLLLFELPRGYLPTEADRAAGARFVEQLRRIDGEVLVPAQGYAAGLAGKRVYAHQMPVSDYAKSGLPEAPALQREYEDAVRTRRFAVIVDSNTGFVRRYVGLDLLEENYEMAGWVFPDPDVFLPISGAQIRPGKIWIRRAPDEAQATASGP
jgi:4-amino-4-deoxy-L-arabinose transferase-like glycosyltransferase